MKIFTVNKKAAVILALVSMLFALPETATAEYKSMIRYDRVWECISFESWKKVIKCMKFDGTEIIDGKEYHRLVTFRRTTENAGDEDGKYNSVDVYEHEGYMREENGVVYSLATIENAEAISDYSPGNWFGRLYVPSDKNCEFGEFVIYDFNHSVGETYKGLSYATLGAYVADFKVTSRSTLDVDGEECAVIEIRCDWSGDYGAPYHIVEGIGAGESGCLNYHEFLDHPTHLWCNNYINRVFDLDGNVIFKTFEFPTNEDLVYDNVSGTAVIGSDPDSDAAIHDLTGRRIAVPAPGQIYIRNGRKHIAPVR